MRLLVTMTLLTCFVLASCAPSTSKESIIQTPAAKASTPAPSETTTPDQFKDMLKHLNDARAQARSCGDVAFDVAPMLRYNALLAESAEAHAFDMDQKKFFSHTGSDQSDVSARVDRTGYDWARVAENLAYGSPGSYSAAEIVDGWLASPGHCKNIMNPVFKEVGLAKLSTDLDYWVHVFGVAN